MWDSISKFDFPDDACWLLIWDVDKELEQLNGLQIAYIVFGSFGLATTLLLALIAYFKQRKEIIANFTEDFINLP